MGNDHHEKLNLIQDLIALSQIDGNDSPLEEHFIYTVARQLGLTEFDIKQVQDQAVRFNPQNKEVDRVIQFYRLLLLMNIDQVKADEEISFCKELGLKLGLNPVAMNVTIQKMVESTSGMMSPNEVIKIFQTYHN